MKTWEDGKIKALGAVKTRKMLVAPPQQCKEVKKHVPA
jgi:hypothetical protein